ncbi:MAG: glycosyltransferase family 2 protein [Azoarcus sp.]|jgi:hypothetical protein|nr:glycosyltransferase family 2 protein [Azoarcus sp.]
MALIYKNSGDVVLLKTDSMKETAAAFYIKIADNLYPLGLLAKSPGLYAIENDLFQVERIISYSNAETEPSLVIQGSSGQIGEENLAFSASFFLDKLDLAKQNIPFFAPCTLLPVYPRPGHLAVFTRAFNEDIFLKIFIDHYKKLTDPDNIFIIDHGSTMVSKYLQDESGIQVIRIPKGQTDDQHAARYFAWFQRFLLSHYEWVISSDCDELLIHREGVDGLKTMLSHPGNIIKCGHGIGVIMDPDSEMEIDLQRPVSQQRRFMYHDPVYAKPALASAPTTWHLGFHQNLDDHLTRVCDDLWLVHLRDVSVDERVRRSHLWADNMRRVWSSSTVEKLRKKQETIAREFRDRIRTEAVPIPEWMRGMF